MIYTDFSNSFTVSGTKLLDCWFHRHFTDLGDKKRIEIICKGYHLVGPTELSEWNDNEDTP
jgi:hypothetical protein